MPSAEGSDAQPDAFAVSPAVGPLPAIYICVPASLGRASTASRLGHAAVRAARRASRSAVRTLSQAWRGGLERQPPPSARTPGRVQVR
jgi:hypothetical protein